MPAKSSNEYHWGRTFSSVEYENQSSSYLRMLCVTADANRLNIPTIKANVDTRLFRVTGISIWDDWRVYSAGLFPGEIGITPDGRLIRSRTVVSWEGIYRRFLALIGKESGMEIPPG
ncbi:hypothetical protein BJX76DRAFT_75825 [Aspergillus varians]